MIKIGFTGTQQGMTMRQAMALSLYLDIRNIHQQIELHHGDCVGADEQAYKIARNYGHRTWCHPPFNGIKRAWTESNDGIEEPADYIVRNHAIVANTKFLIATPKEYEEVQRSGTWSTIREARRRGKDVMIIWPDGDVDKFTGPYNKKIKMRRQE